MRMKICNISISLLLVALMLPWTAAAATGIGAVSALSGSVLAQKGDGTVKILAVNSVVEQGDTVVTEKNSYCRIKFVDGGIVTLHPESQFVVERFSYDQNDVSGDGAVFELQKGSLRAVTGLVGKRSMRDAYTMKLPSGTIGMSGTSYDVKVCRDNCAGLANGSYVFAIAGMSEVANGVGKRSFNAGQYGYVKDTQTMPEVLSQPPHLNLKAPPFDMNAWKVR